MTVYQQFLCAMSEALTMAHRALTEEVTQQEKDLATSLVVLRLGQVNREIEKVSK